MKKIVLIVLFLISSLSISFSANNLLTGDNFVLKSFQERKKKIVNFIEGDKLENQINSLKQSISSLEIDKKANQQVKEKILNDINQLANELNKTKAELSGLNLDNIENTIKEKNNLIEEKKKELEQKEQQIKEQIELKKKILEKLNNTIQELEISKEKNNALLAQLVKEKEKKDSDLTSEKNKKYIILAIFTALLILAHISLHFLFKKGKIKKDKYAYFKFILLFSYTIFLIWFLFFLYPELSIFLVFISGYLLAINAHIVASFIASVFILERFKIGDVVRFGNFTGQIIQFTPINTYILPMTREGIFVNKPIIVPNYKLIKDEVVKDETPHTFLHTFTIVLSTDTDIDVNKFIEHVEQNILMKNLTYRINSLEGSEDIYRTSFGFSDLGRIKITFTWKGSDSLNKKIERKIMGYFTNLLEQIKKEKEEKEKLEKEEAERKEQEKKELEKKEQEKKLEEERSSSKNTKSKKNNI